MNLRSMYSSGGVGGNMGPASHTSTPPPPFYPSPISQNLHNGDVDPQVLFLPVDFFFDILNILTGGYKSQKFSRSHFTVIV